VIRDEKNPHSFEVVFNAISGNDKEYFIAAYNGIDETYEFLKKVIERFSIDFKISRLNKVDLSILLVAAYEILFMDEIGVSISANEAVELAKKFSNEDSSKFINGVLASVIENKELLIVEFNTKEEIKEEENEEDECENN